MKQRGWTTFGALGLIIAASVGALTFRELSALLPFKDTIAPPIALLTLFILPLAYCSQLLFKLWAVKRNDSLSKTEARRIASIVGEKTRQLVIALIFYVLAASFIGVFHFFISHDPIFLELWLIMSGALLAISMFSMLLIFIEMQDLDSFSDKIEQRNREKKRQRSALRRLKAP